VSQALAPRAAATTVTALPNTYRLRTAIAWDWDGWMLLDPQTLMFTGEVWRDHPRQVFSRLLDNEFVMDDVIKFCVLARSPCPAGTLSQATGSRPERSPRYRTIFTQLGCGDELRAVFRAGGTCWGGLSLVRGRAAKPFNAADTALVAAADGHIADALRRSLTADIVFPASAGESAGVLVLDGNDAVASLTPEASYLLGQAGRDDHERLPLPMAVYSVSHRARAVAAGRAGGPPTARFWIGSGRWLSVEAAPLAAGKGSPEQVAVVVQPARPAHLAPLVLMARGLTARERQIALLLLRGDTTEQIARRLVISRHTLRDHIKTVYAKLDVTSRPELTALLLHEETTLLSTAEASGGLLTSAGPRLMVNPEYPPSTGFTAFTVPATMGSGSGAPSAAGRARPVGASRSFGPAFAPPG